MEFDIDVSGDDLLSKNYTICIANKDSIIRGFKFSPELVRIINSRYGQGAYRYGKSKKGRAQLKVRIYCVIIYHLFMSLSFKGSASLNICRDFDGKEHDIESNLRYFLGEKLGYVIERISFGKLEGSNAHKYSYLMRKDEKNQLKTYVKTTIQDIEEFIKRK
jgi:hypothetical protein